MAVSQNLSYLLGMITTLLQSIPYNYGVFTRETELWPTAIWEWFCFKVFGYDSLFASQEALPELELEELMQRRPLQLQLAESRVSPASEEAEAKVFPWDAWVCKPLGGLLKVLACFGICFKVFETVD